jgi:hypothetical protein
MYYVITQKNMYWGEASYITDKEAKELRKYLHIIHSGLKVKQITEQEALKIHTENLKTRKQKVKFVPIINKGNVRKQGIL